MNRKPVSHKLQLDNAVIEYTVQRDRRRKKTVQLSVFNGNIMVSAPIRTPDHEIQAIVRKRSRWILDKLAKMSAGSKELSLPELATGDALPYLGQELPLAVNEAELASEKPKQVAAQREAELRQREAERAIRATLVADLLKGPAALVRVISTLIRLPTVLYKKHRLEIERTKQIAAERESERQRQEAERAQQAAAEREAWEAQQEAERQQRDARRARQAVLKAQQRKRQQYWESLNGIAFERELGKLYRAQGYSVKSTPTSGDQGVDLILTKNGKTTVVQCKAHKNPIGPSVARELFGSMHHFKADSAILACTGGFTDGVIKFARGKPIRLISAWDIVRMVEESGDGMQDITESLPICPKRGCGEKMVLREGYSIFWGCPRYPTCRGTRNL